MPQPYSPMINRDFCWHSVSYWWRNTAYSFGTAATRSLTHFALGCLFFIFSDWQGCLTDVQGWTKITFQVLRIWGEIISLSSPVAGRKTQLFHLIFIQPGKVILGQPCRRWDDRWGCTEMAQKLGPIREDQCGPRLWEFSAWLLFRKYGPIF